MPLWRDLTSLKLSTASLSLTVAQRHGDPREVYIRDGKKKWRENLFPISSLPYKLLESLRMGAGLA